MDLILLRIIGIIYWSTIIRLSNGWRLEPWRKRDIIMLWLSCSMKNMPTGFFERIANFWLRKVPMKCRCCLWVGLWVCLSVGIMLSKHPQASPKHPPSTHEWCWWMMLMNDAWVSRSLMTSRSCLKKNNIIKNTFFLLSSKQITNSLETSLMSGGWQRCSDQCNPRLNNWDHCHWVH